MTQANNIQRYIAAGVVSLAILLGLMFALPSPASASIDSSLTGGSCLNLSGATCAGASTGGTRIEETIKTVINIFSIIVGIVAVIMIILGGFKYITSNGDANNVSSAKNTILYAIVGLIIVALSQAIVWFVLAETT